MLKKRMLKRESKNSMEIILLIKYVLDTHKFDLNIEPNWDKWTMGYYVSTNNYTGNPGTSINMRSLSYMCKKILSGDLKQKEAQPHQT